MANIKLLAAGLTAALLAASPVQATGPTRVPPAFLGEWNYDLPACGKGTDDSRLHITPNSLRFWESSGPILSVKVHSTREISLTARLSGEGETWTTDLRYRLSADGKELADITEGETDPFVRKRCPKS